MKFVIIVWPWLNTFILWSFDLKLLYDSLVNVCKKFDDCLILVWHCWFDDWLTLETAFWAVLVFVKILMITWSQFGIVDLIIVWLQKSVCFDLFGFITCKDPDDHLISISVINWWEKTHAEVTHIITNQLQKINKTRFNVVRSSTATYIHTNNY